MKKKVLFALIALFSVLSVWANRTVTVTQDENTSYRVVLSNEAVLLGSKAPTFVSVTVGVKVEADFTYGEPDPAWECGDLVYSYDATNKKLSVVGDTDDELNEVGTYYLQLTKTAEEVTTTFYVPFKVGKAATTEILWDKTSWENSQNTEGRLMSEYHKAFPWAEVWDNGDASADPVIPAGLWSIEANCENTAGIAAAIEAAGGENQTRYVYNWLAQVSETKESGAAYVFNSPYIGFATTEDGPYFAMINVNGNNLGYPVDQGNKMKFGTAVGCDQTFNCWSLADIVEPWGIQTEQTVTEGYTYVNTLTIWRGENTEGVPYGSVLKYSASGYDAPTADDIAKTVEEALHTNVWDSETISFILVSAETPAVVDPTATINYYAKVNSDNVDYAGANTPGPGFTVYYDEECTNPVTITEGAGQDAYVVVLNEYNTVNTIKVVDETVDDEADMPSAFDGLHAADKDGNAFSYFYEVRYNGVTFYSDEFVVNPVEVGLTLALTTKNYGAADPKPDYVKSNGVLQDGDRFQTNAGGNIEVQGMDVMTRYESATTKENIGTHQYTVNKDLVKVFTLGSPVEEPVLDEDTGEPTDETVTVTPKYMDYTAKIVAVGQLDILPRTLETLAFLVDDQDFDGSAKEPAVAVYFIEDLDEDGEPKEGAKAVTDNFTFDNYKNNVCANLAPVFDENTEEITEWTAFRALSSVEATCTSENFGGEGVKKTIEFGIRQKNINAGVQPEATQANPEPAFVYDVTIVQGTAPIYNGEPQTKPVFTVTDTKQKPEAKVLNEGEKNETTQTVGQADAYVVIVSEDAGEANNINATTAESKAHATIQGVNNYYGERAVDFDIAKKAINGTNFDFALDLPEAGYVYDGQKKTPGVTVTPKKQNANDPEPEPLPEEGNYTVSYGENIHAAAETATPAINYVTVTGTGNYQGSVSVPFAIAPTTLTVTAPQDATKAFGDEEPAYQAAVSGWKNDDDKLKWDDDEDETTPDVVKVPYQPSALATELAGMYTIGREEGEDKGEYALTFAPTTGTELPTKFAGTDDYTIVFVDGKLTIGVHSLNIIANNATASFGDDLASDEFAATLTYSVDEDCFQNGDDASILTGYEFEVYVIDPTTIHDGANYNALRVKEKNGKVAPSNYQFVFVDGNLTLGKKVITVTADAITEVYGQNKPFTYTIDGLLYPAFDPTTVEGYDDMTDEQKAAAEATYIAGQETDFRTFLATGAGDYNGQPFMQEIPEGAEAASADFSETPYNIVANEEAPEVYGDNYTITYVGSTLTRNQREVDVTARTQWIGYGEDIDQGEYDIEGVNADNTRGLLEADANNFGDVVLSVEPGNTSIGTHKTVIYAVVNNKNKNYHINYKRGDLIIEAGGRIALHLNRPYLGTNYDPKDDFKANGKLWDETKPAGKLVSDRVYDENEGKDTETARDNFRFSNIRSIWEDDERVEVEEPIEIPNTADQLLQDYDGQTAKIHFGDFNFYKDRWYTLVLPFDTKVSDISKAFGYAVIDVLDVTNTDKTAVSFKQYIHEIPANTPFLIKVPEDINMKDVVFFAHKEYEEVPVLDEETGQPILDEETGEPLTETKLVTKHGYEIQYASEDDMKAAAEEFDATAAAATASKTNVPVALKDLAGNTIIGTYLGKYGLEVGKETTLGNSGTSVLSKGATGSAYIYPFGAYFRVADATSAADLRLLIEEADGTVTAITAAELGNANEAGAAEGWYTLTGIKLNGKPTVKGTYIYNGRTVYVK